MNRARETNGAHAVGASVAVWGPAAGATLIVLVTAWAVGHGTGLPVAQATALVAAITVVALAAFAWSGEERFGWANAVTLLRLGLGGLLLGAAAVVPLSGAGAWLVFAVATAAFLLDGVDGWLARRLDEVSAFGARFDMEADSLLLIACALLLTVSGLTGVWVLAAGLMRPAFVAAGWLLPWLRRPLPASLRRKTACALAVGLLVASLLPFASALAPVSGMLAVLLLTLSFGIDVAWLRRHG